MCEHRNKCLSVITAQDFGYNISDHLHVKTAFSGKVVQDD